jgi:predicted O-methyltransferase YrrM
MLKKLKQFFNKTIYKNSLNINFVKLSRSSWLCKNLSGGYFKPFASPEAKQIKRIIKETGKKGRLRLYEGYKNYKIEGMNYENATRNVFEVSTEEKVGDFFYWLVLNKRPSIIVEIGTAFGVSGMYLLSGLKKIKKGQLFTFEVNKEWANIAIKNLESIGSQFSLTIGKFEENFDNIFLPKDNIDIAFIDGVHVGEVVHKQIAILRQNMHDESLIILDDINFSSEMKSYWKGLAIDSKVKASVEIGGRIGIIELRQSKDDLSKKK